jgi:hypothetical protein
MMQYRTKLPLMDAPRKKQIFNINESGALINPDFSPEEGHADCRTTSPGGGFMLSVLPFGNPLKEGQTSFYPVQYWENTYEKNSWHHRFGTASG